jgi:hypothetical protein
MSRQNYYKERKRRRKEADGGAVEQLVRGERALQPRLGGRKLFHMPGPKLALEGVAIGRDRFFGVLREKELRRFPPRPGRRTAATACRCFTIWSRTWSLAAPTRHGLLILLISAPMKAFCISAC